MSIVRRGDDLVEETGIDHIDVSKVDVEELGTMCLSGLSNCCVIVPYASSWSS
jgi:hypothetical protein